MSATKHVSRRTLVGLISSLPCIAASACATASSAPARQPENSVGASPLDVDFFDSEVVGFAQTDAIAFPRAGQVLFVGSSSIRIWGTIAENMAQYDVLNRGFGGAMITHVNRSFPTIVEPYRPSAIVFYCGENDIHAQKSSDTVVDDFAAFVDMRDRSLPGTPLFFISIKPSPSRFSELETQVEVNRRVEAMTRTRHHFHYVDVATRMLDEANQPRDLFVYDRLHMHAAGYAIWSQAIQEVLAAANIPTRSG